MNINRRIAKAAAIGMAAAGLVTVGAVAPANAADSTKCGDGYLCIWEDVSYKTNGDYYAYVRLQKYIPKLSGWSYAGTSVNANDSASSTHNNTNTYSAYYFQLDNCDGYSFQKLPNTTDGDFLNGTPSYADGSSANNRTSSIALSPYIGTQYCA